MPPASESRSGASHFSREQAQHSSVSPSSVATSSPSTYSTEELLTAADVYFQRCHNQPYSLFDEATFRQRLEAGTVPEVLLLAFLATARRFQYGPSYQGPNGETINSLAARSWAALTPPWGQATLEYHVALPSMSLLF